MIGFRKGVATEDVIFKITNEILNASNNKTMAFSILYDLEKAFDSVNHDLLLFKVPYYGISVKG
jgi:retron-type reverse transcriptase